METSDFHDAPRPFDSPQQQEPLNVEPLRSGRSGLKIFAVLGWIATAFCLLIIAGLTVFLMVQGAAISDYYDTTEGIQEKYHSLNESASDKIAIIGVKGVIMEGDGFVKRQIDRVKEDKDVKAVVLRIDSPGGTVSGSDYLYHHLNNLREEKNVPIVVSMGSVAASGGYYVAMAVGHQEDSIFAEPTTTTGSIGVIIPHYDISRLLEKWHVTDDSIASHPRKQIGSMTKTMTPEERQILQSNVTDMFNRFKEIVKRGRAAFAENEEALVELATGEIFSARQAHENGLVDKIGYLESAIERAVELAGLSQDVVRAVQYKKPAGFVDILAGRSTRMRHLDLDSVLELTTPRAFYLCTSLPPLMTSGGP